MGWKDAQGNEINTEGVDTRTLDVVGKIIGGAVAQATAGMKTAVAEAVTAAVEEHVTPLATKVEEIGKAKPADKGDGGDKTDLQKAIEAAVAPVLERVDALKSERDQERAAQTSRQIAEGFVAKHYPNLRGRELLVKRLAAAGVKSEEDARKGFDAWKEEQAAFGVDVTKLAASPEGEGAKDQPKGGEAEAEEAKRSKIEGIKAQGKSKWNAA